MKKEIRTASILGLVLFALVVMSFNSGNNSKSPTNNDAIQKVTSDRNTAINSVSTKTVLTGNIGSAPEFGSSWIDLSSPMDFKENDSLILDVAGASKVLVRLLVINGSPDQPVVIIGQYTVVNGQASVFIKQSYIGIKQISVHGGENPWGRYPLGAGNKPATLQQVILIRNK